MSSKIPAERPNVIWFMVDQMRAQSLGFLGDPNVNTPNLNHLATLGVTFNCAVTSSPICSPARASVLTGQYPHQHGVPINGYRLDPQKPTVASAFAEYGYHTAWFGKWHVDAPGRDAGPHTPKAGLEYVIPRERRGHFETWLGYENLMNPAESWVYGHNEDGAEVAPYLMREYDTDGLSDLMVAYLRRRGKEQRDGNGRPFFAALSCFAPHDPYFTPPEWMARYRPGVMALRPNVPDISRVQERARVDLAGYYAMIENIDWNLGRIRAVLEEEGLARNTHVVFFSDHGDMLGSHGLQRKSVPFEEAIRVPCIIGGEITRWSNWDGRGNGMCDAPLGSVDIAPTSLGLCGIDTPVWMAGTDYSGHRILGRPVNDPDSAYAGIWQPMGWDGLDRPWRCLITRDGWKYTVLAGQPLSLFNLNEDPYEMVNLVFDILSVGKRKQLQARLERWIRDTGDDFTLPQ